MLRFLRATLAGAAATLVDIGVLALLVLVFRLSPGAANVPALIAGGVVSFAANRHFVFRAGHGSLAKQLASFFVVEVLALALNGVLYAIAMRLVPAQAFVLARLVTTNLVFVAWSFPLWHFVFRAPDPKEAV